MSRSEIFQRNKINFGGGGGEWEGTAFESEKIKFSVGGGLTEGENALGFL